MRALMDRYPDFFRASPEFTDTQAGLETEMRALWSARDGLMDQVTVDTATWGLSYWEKTLGIPVEQGNDLAYRRSRIRSKLRGFGVTTVAVIESVAKSFTSGAVTVTEFPRTSRLEIKFGGSSGAPLNLDDLTATLREIMPAHLAWHYVTAANIYAGMALVRGDVWYMAPLECSGHTSSSIFAAAIRRHSDIIRMAAIPCPQPENPVCVGTLVRRSDIMIANMKE